MSIAGIVLSIAVPSFTPIITSNRLTANANELMAALNLARSEAIKRGVQVIVNRKSTTDSQWENGWDVFVDNDGSNTFNNADIDNDGILCETGEDCLLRTYDALPSGYTLRSGGNYVCWVAYTANGLSRGSGPGPACNGGFPNDSFRLCNGMDNATMRRITINPVGRVRVSTGTDTCP